MLASSQCRKLWPRRRRGVSRAELGRGHACCNEGIAEEELKRALRIYTGRLATSRKWKTCTNKLIAYDGKRLVAGMGGYSNRCCRAIRATVRKRK